MSSAARNNAMALCRHDLLAHLDTRPKSVAEPKDYRQWAQTLGQRVSMWNIISTSEDTEVNEAIAEGLEAIAPHAEISWLSWARGEFPDLAVLIEWRAAAAEKERKLVKAAARLEQENKAHEEIERRRKEAGKMRRSVAGRTASAAASAAGLRGAEGEPAPSMASSAMSRVPSRSQKDKVQAVPVQDSKVERNKRKAAKHQSSNVRCDRCAQFKNPPECVVPDGGVKCMKCIRDLHGCYWGSVSLDGKVRGSTGAKRPVNTPQVSPKRARDVKKSKPEPSASHQTTISARQSFLDSLNLTHAQRVRVEALWYERELVEARLMILKSQLRALREAERKITGREPVRLGIAAALNIGNVEIFTDVSWVPQPSEEEEDGDEDEDGLIEV
ncbi:hypothetical protein AcV5_005875 [Taiwanofungus camphoratus]|nr:hypothetical protein AcV5_005875 [Antrodia cinnamomea]